MAEIDHTQDTPWIYVSPQAGLCNRLRVLASCYAMCREFGYRMISGWDGREVLKPTEPPHVALVKQFNLEKLVDNNPEANLIFRSGVVTPGRDGAPKAELLIAEWKPESFWGRRQTDASVAEDLIQDGDSWRVMDRLRTEGRLPKSIVLQTSLPCNDPSLSDRENCELRRIFYETCFSTIFRMCTHAHHRSNVKGLCVGIHCRRGDFARVYPQSIIKPETIETLTNKLKALHSDVDVRLICDGTDYTCQNIDDHVNLSITLAILDINTLIGCDVIVGTPNSSFAKEAAVIGGKLGRYIELKNTDQSIDEVVKLAMETMTS